MTTPGRRRRPEGVRACLEYTAPATMCPVTAELRLKEELGHGALGRVVVVENPATGETFAGKILHESLMGDTGAVERFRREAELLRGVRHPNIVAVHGLETIDGAEVLLMERIDGPSLATLLAHEGPLPE